MLGDILSPMAGEPQDVGGRLGLWDPPQACRQPPQGAQSWYSECCQRCFPVLLDLDPTSLIQGKRRFQRTSLRLEGERVCSNNTPVMSKGLGQLKGATVLIPSGSGSGRSGPSEKLHKPRS